jgi:hypothetical protein
MTLREKFLPRMYCFFGSGMLSNTYDEKVANDNATECEKITDELAVGFAEWMLLLLYDKMYNNKPIETANVNELLKIYKKENGL